MNTSVVFENVSKKYKLYNKTSDKLLDLALPQGYGKDFFALRNVSFTAEKGDIIGVIGVNGAGKSTISNLITGIIPPTHGSIKVDGESSLISIASGLNTQLSGRENIELKLLMLGFSKQNVQELEPAIIDFADIGQFIDQPVKSYSSGMKSRLGFAISVNVDPDVIVIDEALSVGDKTFTQKCLVKMNEFKEKGKTIFFVSHSIGQIKEFCQKALWLEAGEIKAYGAIGDVLPQYEKFINDYKKMTPAQQKLYKQQVMEKRSQPLENQQIKSVEEKSEEHQQQNLVEQIAPSAQTVDEERSTNSTQTADASQSLLKNHLEIEQLIEKIEGTQKEALVNRKQEIKSLRAFTKPGRKVIISSVIGIALTIGGVVTYLNWDNLNGKASTNSSSSENVKDVIQTKNISDQNEQEVPLVNAIRSEFYFGDKSGNITDLTKDNTATLTEKPRIDENVFIAAAGNFILPEKLQTAISFIGKTKEDFISAIPTDLKVYYHSNNLVDGVSFKINPITTQQLVQYAGEPVYQSGDEMAYLYHGQTYDFIIYSTDGKIPNSISIWPVLDQIKQEESPAIQDTPEENTATTTDDDVIISKKRSSSSALQKTSGKKSTNPPAASTGKNPSSPSVGEPPVVQKPDPTPEPPKDNSTPTEPTKPVDTPPEPPPVIPDDGSTDPGTEPPGDNPPSDPIDTPIENPSGE